jgi:hypothetical protein
VVVELLAVVGVEGDDGAVLEPEAAPVSELIEPEAAP